jgi:hypothetical protein
MRVDLIAARAAPRTYLNDPGMLDVVGFDAATPQLISDFVGRAL